MRLFDEEAGEASTELGSEEGAGSPTMRFSGYGPFATPVDNRRFATCPLCGGRFVESVAMLKHIRRTHLRPQKRFASHFITNYVYKYI